MDLFIDFATDIDILFCILLMYPSQKYRFGSSFNFFDTVNQFIQSQTPHLLSYQPIQSIGTLQGEKEWGKDQNIIIWTIVD